ncbi:hypothetical protein IFT37_21875 [Pseudomonas fluorescens]|uniref:hypothetical protein n=1 Tax=Pseudomonas fluorescens group TaxID=136843 RepID=UPI001786715C|nr:hypothetical protein [Pseudomonas fluorescens]MBD8150309.1 hypothetical protein [Pseudomonas fluorescens]MBD8178477.1 hypothetical protein [Pseudomonas fluorescens]MBD8747752.1 hypothetical protein [Pseudomonas fluorescens]MBD8752335.1 hypothetical protein [Pseudomonas fluorescens]MBD8761115.1 hypothetical protein [Pseudomonas fluorescens]
MMLLRTLVLERSGEDAPVNGALLCGFAVAQTSSNFLVYSLDEEAEPGHSRVYIAALRKKLERYFLGGVESKEDLQVAMQVFKQILMMAAASGNKESAGTESQVPFHFIDLKGCRLPPARPEDHHSVIVKKALVMKVITLGMSAPAAPAIESSAVIVPSIRFSSQMIAPPRGKSQAEPVPPPEDEDFVEEPPAQVTARVESQVPVESNVPIAQSEPIEMPSQPAYPKESTSILEIDSTLSNLARVAQELTQKKQAVIEREAMLEQWQARLQQQQTQQDERSRALDQHHSRLQEQELEVSQKTEKMVLMMSQLSLMRQRLQGTLVELDQVLDGQG